MDDPKVHVCVCTQCTQFYPFGMTTGSIISSMSVFWVPFWFRAVVFCPILRHIFQLLYIKPTYNKTLGKCFITKLSVESVHSFDTFDRVTEHLGHRSHNTCRHKECRARSNSMWLQPYTWPVHLTYPSPCCYYNQKVKSRVVRSVFSACCCMLCWNGEATQLLADRGSFLSSLRLDHLTWLQRMPNRKDFSANHAK